MTSRPPDGRARAILPAAMLLACAAAAAFAMEVEDAYRAIPHRHVVYDASRTTLTLEESRWMTAFHEMVDEAIALRVATQSWLATGGKSGEPLERYRARMDGLEGRLRALASPRSVVEARDLVLAALADQRAYFESWQREKDGRASRNESLVQSSHSRLVQAYNVLMSRFPQEGAGNRDAFFDHLCALDFI
jgi:hypothetical protein